MQIWTPDTCPSPGCRFETFVLPDGEEAVHSVVPCVEHVGLGTPQATFEIVRSENWAANTAVHAAIDELPGVDPMLFRKELAPGTRAITITVPGLPAGRVNAVRAASLVKFNARHAERASQLVARRANAAALDASVAEVDRVVLGNQVGSTKKNREAALARGDAAAVARFDFAIAQLAAWKTARSGGGLQGPPSSPARPPVTIVAP